MPTWLPNKFFLGPWWGDNNLFLSFSSTSSESVWNLESLPTPKKLKRQLITLIHIKNWIELIGLVGKSPEENVTELCYGKKNDNTCLKIIKWRTIGLRVIILSPLSIENRGCLLKCPFENEWCYHADYWPNEICSIFFPLRVPSLSKHKAERYAHKYNYQAEYTITIDLHLLQENLTASLIIFLHVFIYIVVNKYNKTYIECSLQYWKKKHYYYSLVLDISEFFLLFLL